MGRRKRRNFTPEYKAEVVRAAIHPAVRSLDYPTSRLESSAALGPLRFFAA